MNRMIPIRDTIEASRDVESSIEEADLSAKDELVLALVEVGISLRKAEFLVSRYPAGRIRRQLRWLPHRVPKRPASLLIAAIERDYDAPAYAE